VLVSDRAHRTKEQRKADRDWDMGKAAYEAYARATGDDEAFAWEDLATRLQAAWMSAVHAAHQEYEEI
jgi:hypothetical protein